MAWEAHREVTETQGRREPEVLQAVELLVKWLLPTLGEGEAELKRPRSSSC